MDNKKGFELNGFYAKIYRRYDLINRLFTFGLDQKWRKITSQLCLSNHPAQVMDLCCGTGDLTVSLSRECSGSEKITGYDFSEKMLEVAKSKSERLNIKNIEFICGNAANMPFNDLSFDAVTIGFGFRNLTFNNPDSDKHVSEIYRVLKSGGRLYILESGVPDNFLIRLFYNIYLYLFLIPMGALLSGNGKAYWYLAHSSSKFYRIAEIDKLLSGFGFETIQVKRFFFGAANLIIAQK